MEENLYPVFSQLIMFLILAVLVVLLYRRIKKTDAKKPDYTLPESKKTNNNHIVIMGISAEEMETNLIAFNKLYNEEGMNLIFAYKSINPLLHCLSFPYGVDHEYFSYAVNYMACIGDKAKVRGWYDFASMEEWLGTGTGMFYLPDVINKEDVDSVYISTPDQAGYKLDFCFSKAKAVENPVPYESSQIDLKTLSEGDWKLYYNPNLDAQ